MPKYYTEKAERSRVFCRPGRWVPAIKKSFRTKVFFSPAETYNMRDSGISFRNLPIKWKILLPVACMMVLVGVMYAFMSDSIIRKMAIQENRDGMEHLSETVFASISEYMLADKFIENKTKLLSHMNKMLAVSMVRSDKLDAEFGRKGMEEYARSDEEKAVLNSGKPVFVVEKIKGAPYLRGIFPYKNYVEYMGINCTGCHAQGVKEGDILGALSIAVPLAGMEAVIMRSRLIIAGVAFAVTLITIFAVFLILRTFVVDPLNAVVRVVESASRKDFSKVLKVRYKDEIGKLASSVNVMSGELATTMKKVAEVSGELSVNADTLKKAIEQSVEGTKQQAQQAAQIAAASEEMSQTVTGIAQSGSKAADLSATAMDAAKKGKAVVQESVGKIESAGQSTRELASMIGRLSGSVTEIGDIISVIKDIADQTNLLALNAAIEAARAGEQGRGFAVVADEVRKLAERTSKATGEISERVSAVQEGSVQTTGSMENSQGYVDDSVVFMKKVQGALDEIVSSIHMATDEVSQIAVAVEEQSTTASNISQNIEDISVVARKTENSTEELLRTFEDLNRHSQALSGMVEGFRFLAEK